MALVNYKDIDFNKSINKENKIIDFNGSTIEVIQYLSTNDKYDLVMTTVQKAFSDNGIFNDFKAKIYFKLNVIYLYTNLVFTVEDRVDEFELYDILEQSGLAQSILNQIDKQELNSLYDAVLEIQARITAYNNTSAALVYNLLDKIPEKLKKAKEFINSIDQDKLQFVKELSNTFVNNNITNK